jgi:hypothetical protein
MINIIGERRRAASRTTTLSGDCSAIAGHVPDSGRLARAVPCSVYHDVTRCTTGMATLHHPAYEYRDSASRQADTPLFHAVEQKLHAGWLFDPRIPAPGPVSRWPAPRRSRHAKPGRAAPA